MQNERDETLGNFVISNINEAVTLMDQDRNIVYINDGFSRIFSYTREEVVESSIALLGPEKSMSASV
jgi:PAS domain S-box-containing protein